MEIVGAIQSLKLAKDVLKAFRSLQVTAEVQDKLMELQGLVSDAYTATVEARADQFTMQDQIRELKSELMKLENWETEKERYHLNETIPGHFAYVLKEPVDMGEPMHMICPNCYEDQIKSIMQLRPKGNIVKCYRCSLMVGVPFEEPPDKDPVFPSI